MSKKRYAPAALDRARDELFSHIQRCGVLEADDAQRDEWLEDTVQFLAERYPELSRDELGTLRTMGERYCSPAIPHGRTGGGDADAAETEERGEAATEADDPEPSEVGAA